MKNEIVRYNPERDELLFLNKLNRRAELRRTMQELAKVRLALRQSEKNRREEKRAAQREINGMAAFISVGACLVTFTVCMIAAPWWTAIAPLLLALAILQKTG